MDEVDARIRKFKVKASQVASASHLKKIVDSFPEDRRAEILDLMRDSIQPEVIAQYDELYP